MYTHSTISIKYEPVAKSKLSLLPSVDNPVYYGKAAKFLKIIDIQPKQATMATPLLTAPAAVICLTSCNIVEHLSGEETSPAIHYKH